MILALLAIVAIAMICLTIFGIVWLCMHHEQTKIDKLAKAERDKEVARERAMYLLIDAGKNGVEIPRNLLPAPEGAPVKR